MTLVTFEEISPKVGLITLNDAQSLNAMSEKMAQEFKHLVQELSAKKNSFRALILTGAGRAFSAGGDLDMLERKTKLGAEDNKRLMIEFYNSFLCLRELSIPLLAAINGHAIGAGLCVASACDIRLASDKAKLGFTFTRLGLHPGMGATYFLPRVVGHAWAAELTLTGRVIDATEALRIGLVSRVVPEAAVLDEAKKIVQEILECGPLATSQLLQSMRNPTGDLNTQLEREADCQSVNYASAEFKEGLNATREKRKANWS